VATIQDVLNALAQILSPIGVILVNSQVAAKETKPFEIRGYTQEAASILGNGTYGNAAIEADLRADYLDIVALLNAIQTQIGTPAQAGVPVDIAGTSWQAICDAVWGNVPTGDVRNMGYALINVAQSTVQNSYFGIPPQIGHFHINAINFAVNDFQIPAFTYPVWDPGDVLVGDTLLSMMTRQNPGFNCSYGNPPQTNVVLTEPGGAGIGWITDLDETAFSQLKEFYFPLTARPCAPVWPGLGNVTLLTPVALATSLTISEALDGVLVSITAVPTKQGQFAFGDLISWRNAGALAFVEDNGDAEFPQNLGFQSAVYLPKAMAHASGVVVRASPGVTGTVTPFTIN